MKIFQDIQRVRVLKFINTGHVRSVNVKKNTLALLLIKGLSIITGLLIVPITIGYLNPTKYGIWITLTSIIGWFSFFDIGLGNGLRNKLTEALSEGNIRLAKSYVSTAYFLIAVISCIIFVVFVLVNFFLDWNKILNTYDESNFNLSTLALFTFGFFCLRLVSQLISIVFLANQRPAMSGLLNLFSSVFSLLAIYILTLLARSSLLVLGITWSLIPVLVLIVGSLVYYKTRFKNIAPEMGYINLKHIKSLMNLGIQFFLIQITGIIIFSSNNFIISQLYGPSEVTPYAIANKYLGIASMLLAIILVPLWSAFTEAYHKKDFGWIIRVFRKMKILWIAFSILLVFMVLFSSFVYNIWIGDKVAIPSVLSVFIGVYFIIQNWNSIIGTIVNGVGKIRFQLYISSLIALINIPLCIFFAKYLGMGLCGIVLGNMISLIPGSVLIYYQVHLIINNREYGIWSK